jgi:hypothetical protein
MGGPAHWKHQKLRVKGGLFHCVSWSSSVGIEKYQILSLAALEKWD